MGYDNLYYSVKGTHEFVESSQGEFMNNAVEALQLQQKQDHLL